MLRRLPPLSSTAHQYVIQVLVESQLKLSQYWLYAQSESEKHSTPDGVAGDIAIADDIAALAGLLVGVAEARVPKTAVIGDTVWVFVKVTVLRLAGHVDTCQVRVTVTRVPRALAVTVTAGAVLVTHIVSV